MDGRRKIVMRRNYEEIYMYNGDVLLGLARIYEYISNLDEFRI